MTKQGIYQKADAIITKLLELNPNGIPIGQVVQLCIRNTGINPFHLKSILKDYHAAGILRMDKEAIYPAQKEKEEIEKEVDVILHAKPVVPKPKPAELETEYQE